MALRDKLNRIEKLLNEREKVKKSGIYPIFAIDKETAEMEKAKIRRRWVEKFVNSDGLTFFCFIGMHKSSNLTEKNKENNSSADGP